MSKLDTQKVWDALMKDPGFTAQMPAQAHPVMRGLVDVLPDILEPHLGKTVTVAALLETTLAVIEYELASGFIAKLTAALPAEALPFPAEQVNAQVTEALTSLLGILRGVSEDPEAFLEGMGIDDERVFLGHPKGGRLDASSLRAYDAGVLTVRRLLETQPAIFLQYNQD